MISFMVPAHKDVQALNAVMVLITLAMISGPIWGVIPWDTPLGQMRSGITILNCHIGLLAWPCAYVCFRYLLRSNRWLERIRLLALTAIRSWGATPIVISFWTSLYQRLTHFSNGCHMIACLSKRIWTSRI